MIFTDRFPPRKTEDLANHVRQKLLWSSDAETLGDLLKFAEGEGDVTCRDFFWILRKKFHLTSAAVTDDAIRDTYQSLKKDGVVRKADFRRYLQRDFSESRRVKDCLDARSKTTATQDEKRLKQRIAFVRRHLRVLPGEFFANLDDFLDVSQFTDLINRVLSKNQQLSISDIQLVFDAVNKANGFFHTGPVTVVNLHDLQTFLR